MIIHLNQAPQWQIYDFFLYVNHLVPFFHGMLENPPMILQYSLFSQL